MQERRSIVGRLADLFLAVLYPLSGSYAPLPRWRRLDPERQVPAEGPPTTDR